MQITVKAAAEMRLFVVIQTNFLQWRIRHEFFFLDQLYEGRNKALSLFGQSLVTFVLTFFQGRVEPRGLLLDPAISDTHLQGFI